MLIIGVLVVWMEFIYTSFPLRFKLPHVTGMVVLGSDGFPTLLSCGEDVLGEVGGGAVIISGSIAVGAAPCETLIEHPHKNRMSGMRNVR
jgi:hypothetical protein